MVATWKWGKPGPAIVELKCEYLIDNFWQGMSRDQWSIDDVIIGTHDLSRNKGTMRERAAERGNDHQVGNERGGVMQKSHMFRNCRE